MTALGDDQTAGAEAQDIAEAEKVAYRIRQRIAALGDQRGSGVSSGIAVWRRGMDPEDARRQADHELPREGHALGDADQLARSASEPPVAVNGHGPGEHERDEP